jgi:hypothetical protein
VTSDLLKEWFDYSDGTLIWKKCKAKWIKPGDIAGSARKDGYWTVGFFGRSYLVHRLIFLYHHGYLPKLVDHRDQNPANNKIENLREYTKKLNSYNSKLLSNNTSGIRGVSWDNLQQKWTARFRQGPKSLFLGYFKTVGEAAIVRKQFEYKEGLQNE